MFQTERFIEECRKALRDSNASAAVRELVTRAVNDPMQLMRAIGEPRRAGVNIIHRADDLTILNLCWGPYMSFQPHNHCMWAVIGIYTGREENTFFQRDAERGLVRHGTKDLNAGDVAPLGKNVIHAVINPLNQITAALHVYGGDFFATPRSEWDPHSYQESPYNVENTMRAFEASNAQLNP